METYELKEIMQRVSQALNKLARYHKQNVIVVVHDTRKRNLQTTFYNQREIGATTVGTVEDVNG